MKLLLVKPYNKSDHIQPSLGLGYLATHVRKRHTVSILDCIKENIKPSLFEKKINEIDCDIIGFQCYTYDLPIVKDLLKLAKKNNKITIIGGPHPSVDPEGSMQYFGEDLDYCFVGEAEAGLPGLLDRLNHPDTLKHDSVPGLVWRKDEKVMINEKVINDDLDSLEYPAWDLIKPNEYPQAQHGAFFDNFPIAPIAATRGCPYSCTFCAGNLISGKKWRTRSPEHIVSEIKHLHDNFGIKEIHITDDNFTLDKNFAKNVLREIKKLDFKISWAVPNGIRMESLDDELLGLMKDTGLYLISLGIESGSDRVLGLMNKNISTKKIQEAVDLISRHKIDMAGFFILGFPGEKTEEIKETIDFALKLNIIRANFFTYLPFPGTASYEKIKNEEGLEKVSWDNFYFFSASYAPSGISKKQLKKLQRSAFFRFYFRPRIFLKNIACIKSPKHLFFLIRRFKNWILPG